MSVLSHSSSIQCLDYIDLCCGSTVEPLSLHLGPLNVGQSGEWGSRSPTYGGSTVINIKF